MIAPKHVLLRQVTLQVLHLRTNMGHSGTPYATTVRAFPSNFPFLHLSSEVVGLMMDRCVAQVIAVFGTLKAPASEHPDVVLGSVAKIIEDHCRTVRLVQPSCQLTMLSSESDDSSEILRSREHQRCFCCSAP